jgi:hypothetical protein
MPSFVARLSSRYALGCFLAAIAVAAAICAPKVQRAAAAARTWSQYHSPAPVGAREAAVRQLLLSHEPIERRYAGLFEYFSDGFVRHATPAYTRVQYGGARSWNGYGVDGLEGFARTAPLLAAWIYSGRRSVTVADRDGRSDDLVEMLRSGILGGVDPGSSQYWGDIQDHDQRIVEAADIARVLWLTRASIWDKLPGAQKRMIADWLLSATNKRTPPNNWLLFRVVISVVLVSLDGAGAPAGLLEQAHASFAEYTKNYLDHGWFYDRPRGVDFYNTWGITYDLFWIHTVDPDFESDFVVAAIEKSAQLTQYLISPQGIPIMGRSICYRTAVPVPLLAATFLSSSELAAGRALRGLDVVWRYFVAHDSLRDGALTQGYFKADPRVLDPYSGTGSCHWGLRSLILAFMHPPGDRFWTATQQPLPVEESDYRLDLAMLGWIVEGHRASGEITITIPRNPHEVNTMEGYSWITRAREIFSSVPLRPENYEIKYASRHYSSASPFPLKQ